MNRDINLIDYHFQKSNLFFHLPIFDVIYFLGSGEGKIHRYRTVREDQECLIYALTLIRKEDDLLWESFEDLLVHSIREAASRAHGIFSFELLTFNLHKEVKSFQTQELSTVVVNASRKIKPGEKRLIQYSSVFGWLLKMVEEDWGKITFKTSVEIYKDRPVFLDLYLRHLLKSASFANQPVIFFVNDISLQPIYDPQNKDQQDRLSKLMAEQTENTIEFLPEVYIQDANGVRELMSGSQVA